MDPSATLPGGTRDDQALMRAIAAGDPSALGHLYDRHSATVLSLCLRILRNPPEAEEVLGDVFYELWDRSARYDPGRGNPSAYLITLTRSRALDRLRSSRRHREREVPGDAQDGGPFEGSGGSVQEGDSPFEAAVAAERRVRVRTALASLHPEQRRAVELNFFDGFSHLEIAERLGEPLGTIKTRIRQGLVRLRDSLRAHYGGRERA